MSAERDAIATKALIEGVELQIETLKAAILDRNSTERRSALLKLQVALMYLGKDSKAIEEEHAAAENPISPNP